MALDLHDRSVPHCRRQSPVVERQHFAGQLPEGLQFVPPDVVPIALSKTVDEERLRAPTEALRFADPRVQALLHVLLLFLLVQGTFTHKDLREHLAPLLGQKPSQMTPGRITYDLRRLRLHALTERIPKTHRY